MAKADFLKVVSVLCNVVKAIIEPIIYWLAYLQGIDLQGLIVIKYATRSMACFVLSYYSSERKDWRKLRRWSTLACAAIAGSSGGAFPEITYMLSMIFLPPELAGIVSALAWLFSYILEDVIRREDKFLSWKVVSILVLTVGSAILLAMMNEGTRLIDIRSDLDLAPSPMPSTSPGSGVPLDHLLVSFAISTIFKICTACFPNLQQKNMCPDMACTFALGGLMDFAGALTAGIFFKVEFKDLQLNTITGVMTLCCVFAWVIASVGLKYCEQQKGKSHGATLFSSLSLIIETIADPLVFTGELYLGSVVTCISMIIETLYQSIWAKAKEAAGESITVTEDAVPEAASNDYRSGQLSLVPSRLAAPHLMYKQNLLKDTAPRTPSATTRNSMLPI